MDNFKQVITRGLVPGTLASVISTAALALRARRENGSPYAGTNATSHAVWGDEAFTRNAPSWKYTLVGYGIHHASSLVWATIFEQVAGKILDRKSPAATTLAAAGAAAVACFVDYQLTPKRLQPGFEERVSRKSMALVYAAFGLGLAAGAYINHRDRQGV